MIVLIGLVLAQANGLIVPPICWVLWAGWVALRVVALWCKDKGE